LLLLLLLMTGMCTVRTLDVMSVDP
jgi:hypothetical protein